MVFHAFLGMAHFWPKAKSVVVKRLFISTKNQFTPKQNNNLRLTGR